MADAQILAQPPPPPVFVPPPQPPSTIFRGPNGIRAGWRVLIFLLLVAGIGITLVIPFVILNLVNQGAGAQTSIALSGLTPLGLSITEGALFFCTAIAALFMTRMERREFGQYGLPLRSAFRGDFWVGTLVGFLAISGCLLAIFLLHGFHLASLAIHGGTLVSATVAWGATFVLVGLAEEFAFRGYLQYTLTTGMGFWPAAFLMSGLFALAHFSSPGETAFGLFSVVLFGLVFCLILRRTGNLWWAVGFHAGWDWGQTFFYGVPDSGIAPYHNLFNSAFNGPAWLTGGSVGPEASVFTPITLALVAVLFTSLYRGKSQALASRIETPVPRSA